MPGCPWFWGSTPAYGQAKSKASSKLHHQTNQRLANIKADIFLDASGSTDADLRTAVEPRQDIDNGSLDRTAVAFPLAAAMGFMAFLWYDVFELMHHVVLRMLLLSEGTISRCYSTFLSCAVSLIYLRRVGGVIFFFTNSSRITSQNIIYAFC